MTHFSRSDAKDLMLACLASKSRMVFKTLLKGNLLFIALSFCPLRIQAAGIGTESCADLLLSLKSLPSTWAALPALKTFGGHRNVKLLINSEGNQAIVLLGEKHMKPIEDSMLENQVIRKFRARAVELSNIALSAIQVGMSKKTLDEIPKDRVPTPRQIKYYSPSTEDALLTMTGLERSAIYDAIEDEPYIPGMVVGRSEVFAIDTLPEKHPVVDRVTHAHLASLVPSAAVISVYFLLKALDFANLSVLGDAGLNATQVAALVGAANISYFYLNAIVGHKMEKFADRPWFKFLFPRYFFQITLRNKTMVDEIENIFSGSSDISELVVVVGQRHVDGLARLLAQKNWKEVNFR